MSYFHSSSGVFNIYDWGGTPDPTGATDSSNAINLATTAAMNNGGGQVFIPPGKYAIMNPIILYPGVQLVGSGQSDTSITALVGLTWGGSAYTTVMVANSANIPGAAPPSSPQAGMEVRDITFDGNASGIAENPPTGPGDESCIAFGNAVDVIIKRCTVRNCWNHAITLGSGKNSAEAGGVQLIDNTVDVMATEGSGTVLPTGNISIRVTGYNNVIIRNNVVGYNAPATWTPFWGNDGMEIFYCSDVTVSGNQIQLVTDGIDCLQGDNCVLVDNIVENYRGFGIRSFRAPAPSTSAVSRLIIENNVVNACTKNDPQAGTPIISKGGIVADAGLPNYGTGTGPPEAPSSSHYSIANNTVTGPTGNGIINCGAPNGTCTGNSVNLNTIGRPAYPQQIGIFIKNPGVSVRGNQIYDSGAASSTGTGIRFVTDQYNLITTITGVVVDSNTISQTLKAIDVETTISDVSITNNNVIDNTNGINIGTGTGVGATNCRIAGNLTPQYPLALSSPPTFPGPQTNQFNYDCLVTIAGPGITSVTVNTVAIDLPSATVAGPLAVKVPVNGMIEVGGGSGWSWIPL